MPGKADTLEAIVITGNKPNRVEEGVEEVVIHAPRLRQLEITGFHFPLDRVTIQSPQLTQLSLQLTASINLHSVQQYYNLLAPLINLEDLRLMAKGDCSQYTNGFIPGAQLPRMQFPRLHTVEFYYLPAPTTFILLQSIESLTCKRIDVRIRSFDGSEVDPLMNLSLFPSGTIVPQLLYSPTSLQVTHTQSSGWTSIWAKQVRSHPNDVTSIFIDSLLDTKSFNFAQSVMTSVDLSQVNELDLTGSAVAQLLHPLLHRLEKLHSLAIHDGGDVDNIVSTLGSRTSGVKWLCPDLKRLGLHGRSPYSQQQLLQFARERYGSKIASEMDQPASLDALHVEAWDFSNYHPLMNQDAIQEIVGIIGQDVFDIQRSSR